MASEQEIERLVIRLMGDSSNYRAVLDQAVKESVAAFQKMEREAKDSKGQKAWMAQHNALLADAASITASLQSPMQQYQQQVARLTTHLQAGAISQQTFNQAMTQAQKQLQSLSMQPLINSLNSLGGTATLVGGLITALFGGIATTSVMAAARFEQTRVAFTTMLGSAKDAENILERLKKFAAETPFELPEIQQAARGLIQFGESADQIEGTLKILGNAAAGTSSDFGMVSLIFNQIRGVGHLLTQDFRQLSSRGILSLQDLADHFHVTKEAAGEMMTAGKISFADVRKIFEELSADGGRFHDMMLEQSKTLIGTLSNLKDNLGNLGAEIGGYLLPIVRAVAAAMVYLTGVLKAIPDEFKGVIAAGLALGTIFGAIITLLGATALIAGQLAGAYVALQAASIQLTLVTRGLALTMNLAKFSFGALAVVAVGILAYKITSALIPAVRELNAEMERANSLNDRHNRGMTARNTNIFAQADAIKNPTEKRTFLADEMEKAKKEASGTADQVARQKKLVEESAPTWKSLWQWDRDIWNLQKGELSTAEERLKIQNKLVQGLEAQKTALDSADTVEGPSDEAGKAAESYLKSLREQVETFGMSSDEAKIFQLRQQGMEGLAENAEAYAAKLKDLKKWEKDWADNDAFVHKLLDADDAMQFQIDTFGMTSREIGIYKLQLDGATDAMLRQQRAGDKTLTGLEEQKKATEEGKRLMEQFATPQEVYNKKVTDLINLLGVLGPEFETTFARGIASAEAELEKANLDATVTFGVEGNEAVRAGTEEFNKMIDATRARNSISLNPSGLPQMAESQVAVPIEKAITVALNQDKSHMEELLERIAEAVESGTETVAIEAADFGG